MSELARDRRREFGDQIRSQEAAWREANRDKIKQYKREWEDANKERLRDLRRSWVEDNQDHIREYRLKRYRDNPYYREKAHRDVHKRRARIKNLPGESIDRFRVFDRDRWICQLCDRGIPLVVIWPHPLSVSLDHIVPLNHPDSPGHLYSNVQAAHLSCNLSKQDHLTPGTE
jgi:5-methylcytosine-specific restriction endonuclease McrA